MKQRRFILALGILVAVPNRALAQPTFAKDVAPILQEKCQPCHRPGQMAPMSLITYEDVRPWVRAIKARVMAREMPPWYIDKTVGIKKFVADASLSDEQIDAIVRWVDAGAPLGNPKDMPPPRQWPDADSWQLAEHFGRPPDLIVTSPAFTMPAVSEDRWWDPDVDSGLTEDRWVQGVETKPIGKTRRILHHGGTNVFQQEDARIVRAQQALAGGRGRVEDVINAGQDSG